MRRDRASPVLLSACPSNRSRHCFNCGVATGNQQIGKVKFTRTKNDSIIVDVTLYGADSTQHYNLVFALNDPNFCLGYKPLGVFKVVDGHFHKVFEVKGVPESLNQFWLQLYNSETGLFDQSTAVKI